MASLVETAWAAGFFDGEGSVLCQQWGPRPQSKQPNGHASIRLQLKQVERDPLERFVAAVGEGRVRGPYVPSNPNARPCYEWAVSGRRAVAVLDNLLPLLSAPKRDQALAAMADVAAFRLANPQIKERV